MAEVLSISVARQQFNSLDDRLRRCQVIYVARHNKHAFAIVDLDYWEGLADTLEIVSDPEAIELLGEALADIRAGRLHDHDDVKRELG